MLNTNQTSVATIIGIGLALASGLFRNPLSRMGVDVVSYGTPLTWITRVIPTQIMNIRWVELVGDAVFWVIIVYAAYYLILKIQKK